MRIVTLTGLLLAMAAWGCGGGDSSGQGEPANAPAAGGSGASSNADAPLSQVELEQGLGPIRDLALSEIDPDLAAEGEAAFTLKCSACHKLDQRYVAPPLGDVLSRRRPEFVMNMILNATEMVQRHPEVKALLAEYYTPMTIQVTEESEARAILEYLRSAQVPVQDAS
ncbi:MAG: cytochrome c [Gemmatimonadetes bacterium]|nr:cytochrome c [Gemmatimonadota bacterium]